MKIEKLELNNFRCFEHINFELHPRMNVMVGINGTGKTALLEAIRIFIGAIFCELDKIENKISTPSIADDDVSYIIWNNNIRLKLLVKYQLIISSYQLPNLRGTEYWSDMEERLSLGQVRTQNHSQRMYNQ